MVKKIITVLSLIVSANCAYNNTVPTSTNETANRTKEIKVIGLNGGFEVDKDKNLFPDGWRTFGSGAKRVTKGSNSWMVLQNTPKQQASMASLALDRILKTEGIAGELKLKGRIKFSKPQPSEDAYALVTFASIDDHYNYLQKSTYKQEQNCEWTAFETDSIKVYDGATLRIHITGKGTGVRVEVDDLKVVADSQD